jgi:hypothetical protein
MWKPDLLDQAEFLLDISKRLHREAGIRGYSCMPKRSAITQGQTYYAEINQHAWEGRPEFSGLIRPNVAYGTARTPLLAAMNGYRLAGLTDALMLAIYLEIEAYYLRQAVKTIGRLEMALDDLYETLALAWGYQTRIDILSGVTPQLLTAALVDEDDDL